MEDLVRDLDPKVRDSINPYIDQRIVEASRQLYDALTKKIKAVGPRNGGFPVTR